MRRLEPRELPILPACKSQLVGHVCRKFRAVTYVTEAPDTRGLYISLMVRRKARRTSALFYCPWLRPTSAALVRQRPR